MGIINRKNAGDILIVSFSRILQLVISSGMGILLPVFISVNDYAYYQLYMLYMGFANFLHFGLANGIYLKYGAYDYGNLPRERFRAFIRFFAALEMVVSLIVGIALSALYHDEKKAVLFGFVSVNIVIANVGGALFSSIDQFTKRFKADSIFSIMQSLVQVVLILLVIFNSLSGYVSVLIFVTCSNLIRVICEIGYNKEICFGKPIKLNEAMPEIRKMMSQGFFIIISDWMGIVIVSIDKLFVDNFFPIEVFSYYAFAVSIVTAFYSLVNATCTVVYPYLVRLNRDKYALYYENLSSMILLLSGFALCLYYVLEFLIHLVLPKYDSSCSIIFILLPTVIFKAAFSMVCGNMFKALNLTREYMINTVIALVTACISDTIAYMAFRNVYSLAIASCITFLIWYFYTDLFFVKKLNLNRKKQTKRYIYICTIIACYYTIPKIGIVVNTIILLTVNLTAFGITVLLGLRNSNNIDEN